LAIFVLKVNCLPLRIRFSSSFASICAGRSSKGIRNDERGKRLFEENVSVVLSHRHAIKEWEEMRKDGMGEEKNVIAF
jgi:hypothetical protein